MKTIKKILLALTIPLVITSCSVQQFAVNTTVQPFENGGKAFGEKTKEKEFKKDGDLHILGLNINNSNTKQMAEDLNATSYTVETKTNLFVKVLTCGIVDYKLVKVIKRDN